MVKDMGIKYNNTLISLFPADGLNYLLNNTTIHLIDGVSNNTLQKNSEQSAVKHL